MIRPSSPRSCRGSAVYKNLVKHYIRTGLRASQSICRNYLLDLDEKSDYLDFIEKEVGVGYTLSTAVLALVHANTTLTTSFLAARTGFDGALGAYEEYRFLSIDREAARSVVEAAQNKYAQYFMQQIDGASTDANLTTGGYTFSDPLHAVSTIEYQCTRSGIKSLLSRSVNNSPPNITIDQETGTITFNSAVGAPVQQGGPGGITGGSSGGTPIGNPGGNQTGNTGGGPAGPAPTAKQPKAKQPPQAGTGQSDQTNDADAQAKALAQAIKDQSKNTGILLALLQKGTQQEQSDAEVTLQSFLTLQPVKDLLKPIPDAVLSKQDKATPQIDQLAVATDKSFALVQAQLVQLAQTNPKLKKRTSGLLKN